MSTVKEKNNNEASQMNLNLKSFNCPSLFLAVWHFDSTLVQFSKLALPSEAANLLELCNHRIFEDLDKEVIA